MASFTGSAFANFYKRILQFNRATNVGVGTSLNAITFCLIPFGNFK